MRAADPRPIVRLAGRGLALLALGLAGPVLAAEPAEWEREAPPDVFFVSPTDAAGVPSHAVLRVVSDVTGEALPGATVAFHSGTTYPVTGLVPPDRIGVADAEGWVRIRADDLDWVPSWTGGVWMFVEAPGHAGTAVQAPRAQVRLSPARNAIVEVRDALDRPVAGAVLGVRTANTCGHNPDQRVARTGADGRAVIPDVGPEWGHDFSESWECSAVHPSIALDYHVLEFRSRPGFVHVLHHEPSVPVEGTILDADGTPVSGVHVGTYDLHRGPWTVTDAHGAFRLESAERGSPIYAIPDDWPETEAEPWFRAPPPGIRRTLRLPAKGAEDAPTRTIAVTITVRDAGTKAKIDAGVPIDAVRDADGLTLTKSVEGLERLPPGTWTIRAGGDLSPWALALAPLVVPDDEDAPTPTVVVDVVRHPDLRIAFAGDAEVADVSLVSATDVRSVTADELKAGVVAVPTTEPCAFRVLYPREGEEVRRVWAHVPAGVRAPDAPPLRIPVPAPVVVRAQLAGPDGKPVPGWLATDVHDLLDDSNLDDAPPEGPASLTPQASLFGEGDAEVLVIPEGRTLLPRLVTVPLPAGSLEGGSVDLGVVRLEPRGDRRLSVLRADGTVAEYLDLRAARGGVVRTWRRPEDLEVCDPLLEPLAEGDLVEVDADWIPGKRFVRPVRRRLEGPGPWTIRSDLPDTSIRVDPTTADGRPVEGLLVIDGKPFPAVSAEDEDGKRVPVAIHGLDPGPHHVALSVVNHATRLYRVVLQAGEHRTLSGTLRPLPRVPTPKAVGSPPVAPGKDPAPEKPPK